MSVNSLPSFAQAFSNHSLDNIDNSNALPPIMNSRKRDHAAVVRVKDESPEPDSPLPPSSPQKKRRVTVSGAAPHPLTIDVHPPSHDQSLSTPISPVVMGFSVQRDNPDAIEQVRSMISVKQKQQALIEQRRGSAADIMSPPSRDLDEQQQQQQQQLRNPQPPPPLPPPPAQASARPSRRSPNQSQPSTSRRPQRPPSPPPAQQPHQQTQHSLPPPPISFARRRAALLGGKKKPADIVISPREAHSKDQFQPSIQSAPPSQNAFRFQMAIPRLPNIIGSDNVRRTSTNVPPTPTRLSMQAQHPVLQNRSPPAPSVPISSSLVPPTPTSLHRPGYQGDKAAFLAPFDLFYDALNDSKQLKTWLGEQLSKSSSLIQNLAQQQDRINDTVESLVEKRLSGIRSEMTALRRRVGELEDALHRFSDSPTILPAAQNQNNNKNKVHQNGAPSSSSSLGTVAPEPYTFPAAQEPAPSSSGSRLRPGPDRPELTRRLSSPATGRGQHASENANGRGSPASFDSSTRMSMSATRHDPLPLPSASSSRSILQSPPQAYRDRDREPAPPKHAAHPRPPTPPSRHSTGSGPPSLSRQNSGVPLLVVSSERERDREYADRERDRNSRRDSGMSEDDR